MKWKPYSTQFERNGFTLVEVVAGIFILSTLLVMILVSFGANAKQIKASHDRLEAIKVTHNLLETWNSDENFPSVGEEGTVPENTKLGWRIVKKKSSEIPELEASVIRLEIFRFPGVKQGDLMTSVELLAQKVKRSNQVP